MTVARIPVIAWAVLCLLAAGCSTPPPAAAPENEFYYVPLYVGDAWRYQSSAEGEETLSVRVIGKEGEVYTLARTNGGREEFEAWRADGYYVVRETEEIGGRPVGVVRRLLAIPPREGARWTYVVGDVSVEARVTGFEALALPGGPAYERTVVAEHTWTTPEGRRVRRYWFAPGTGIVRWEDVMPDGSRASHDLVSYREGPRL